MIETHKPDALQAENATLRARVQELERILYPPPPPPKEPDDPNRYFVVPRWHRDRDNLLASVYDVGIVRPALEYARERHPELRWQTTYGWENIPEHGKYVWYGEVYEARRSEGPIPLYKIDDRARAIDATSAELDRLREQDSAMFTESRLPAADASLADWRKFWHRRRILDRAKRECERAYWVACWPLTDYGPVIQAATGIADRALAAIEADVRIDEIEGYLPGGWWECNRCGYPYPDAEAATHGCHTICAACRVAEPRAAKYHAEQTEWIRANGKPEAADEHEQAWQAAIDYAATTVTR